MEPRRMQIGTPFNRRRLVVGAPFWCVIVGVVALASAACGSESDSAGSGSSDLGSDSDEDVQSADAVFQDVGSSDASEGDAAVLADEMSATDSASMDGANPDDANPDDAIPDDATGDSELASDVPDTEMADTEMADTGIADIGLADSEPVDAGDPDAGPVGDAGPDAGEDTGPEPPQWDPVALGLPAWVNPGDPLAGGDACEEGQTQFTHAFIAPEHVEIFFPIGWISNTPGHELPAGHQILGQLDLEVEAPVMAAATGAIYELSAFYYDADTEPRQGVDAFIAVRTCRGFGYGYHHVNVLDPTISALLDARVADGSAECTALEFPEGSVQHCHWRAAPEPVEPLPTVLGGQVIGRLGPVTVAGEPVGATVGMEMGVTNLTLPPNDLFAVRNANHAHHVVCPIESFADPALNAQYAALLDPDSSGTCGTVALSEKGTAAGVWWLDIEGYLDPFGVLNYAEALSVLPATRRPNRQVIATSEPAVGLGNTAFFSDMAPAESETRHNRRFEEIQPGDGVHCYDGLSVAVNVWPDEHPLGHIYLALHAADDAGRLSIQLERIAEGPCPESDGAIADFTFGPDSRRWYQPSDADPPI